MLTLNERAHQLANAMADDADKLGIAVHATDCGARVIDCGVESTGGIEAGRRLAEVCLSGLGLVQILPEKCDRTGLNWFDPSGLFPGLHRKYVLVNSEQPVAACMASQYAGWEIKHDNYFAMGSGPMRAAAGREELFKETLFKEINKRERSKFGVGVLETSEFPPDDVCREIAAKCGIESSHLTLLVARTASPAGTVQIVARSLETALHKLHLLGFDLGQVESGFGVAPLPPVADNDLEAIGWTNDAILYGGWVGLRVTSDTTKIEELGPRVPSNASPDYGRPFAEVFARYDGDFYRIDPLLFSPAMIGFSNSERPELRYGEIAPQVLVESFGTSN